VRLLGWLGVSVVLAGVLTGCSQPVVVDPAPYAADPECARVMLAIPETLGGLEMRDTTSQATSAYGDEFTILVRCGVEPPGPTTETCTSVDVESGSQDWLLVDLGEDWQATSFGRTPAVEVLVPKERADQAVGELLAELSGAAALAPSNGLECT